MIGKNEKLYTVGQVARILGIDHEAGRKRVRRLIKAGKMGAEDHGTGMRPQWLIPHSALLTYLGQRRETIQRSTYLN